MNSYLRVFSKKAEIILALPKGSALKVLDLRALDLAAERGVAERDCR
jgi:hypothetical protein